MITDDEGDVVWFKPGVQLRPIQDFKVQKYRGDEVLTWWKATTMTSRLVGEFVIMNDHYQVIERVRPGNGYVGADMHEFTITPRNTALFMIYKQMPAEGSKYPVLENIVQEVDIETGEVLFEWHGLDHIDLGESYASPNAELQRFDYLHLNAIDIDTDGNLILSARHTSAIYKIDRQSGEIIWRLGGKKSDFAIPADARFAYQHAARRQPDGTISIFDNGGPVHDPLRDYSRGIILRVNPRTESVSLVREFKPPKKRFSRAMANLQILPEGNAVIGWGPIPAVTEYAPSGDVLFDMRLPDGVFSYRAFRFEWEGHPLDRPAIAVRRTGVREVKIWASWNGATEVTRWQVMAGASPERLRPVARHTFDAFETEMTVSLAMRYVAVRALGEEGQVLGASKPVKVDRTPDAQAVSTVVPARLPAG